MPTDPNIILGARPVEMPNPLDSAVKALTMGNLMQERQSNTIKLNQQQREANDQQSLRDAFKNNTKLDANGNPTVDRQGMMSDLVEANPMLAQKQAMDWRQQDLEKLTQQHAVEKQLLFSINDQDSYNAALQKAQQLGIPTPKMPAQYNPNLVRQLQMRSLSAEEQLAQANKQQEFAMQKQKNDVELAKLGQEQAHYQNDKRMKAVEDYNTGVSGSRQQSDAQKELNNVLSAKNLNEIVNQAPGGDLNKLNNQQTKLAMMEVIKMAGGGVPTQHDLETMTPDGLAQRYGGALQKITNKSQPANAGEFLKQGIDYANGLSGVSQTALTKRSNEMLDRLAPYMDPKARQTIKNQITHEFDDAKAPKKSASVMGPDEWLASQKK